MFGRKTPERPNCQLWDRTHKDVSRRAVGFVVERVRQQGLPLDFLAQVQVLLTETTRTGMEAVGLPASPCDQCFEKNPKCPNYTTTAPGELDYDGLIDTTLARLRNESPWTKTALSEASADAPPYPGSQALSEAGERIGRLKVGDVLQPAEIKAILGQGE